MEGEKLRNGAAAVICGAGAAALLWLFFRFCFAALLPFLIAFLLARCAEPLSRRFAVRLGISERVCRVCTVLIFLLLLGWFTFVFFEKLMLEAGNLFTYLLAEAEDPNGKFSQIFTVIKNATTRFPLFSLLSEKEWFRTFAGEDGYLAAHLTEWLGNAAGRAFTLLGDVARRAPDALLFLLVTLIAAFCFAADLPRVTAALVRLLPRKVREKLPACRAGAARIARQYLRAYLLLLLVTFAELLAGFLILRVRAAFLLALITALLDFLPLIGVGAVMLPFALFSFLTGEVARGIGLIVLYAVVTVAHEILEPHLLGKSFGVHPLLMLFFFYVGWRLFGFLGVIAAPFAALLLRAWQTGKNE